MNTLIPKSIATNMINIAYTSVLLRELELFLLLVVPVLRVLEGFFVALLRLLFFLAIFL